MKSGRVFPLVPRRDDHCAEERKANLPAVRVPAKQQVDSVSAQEVDDVGVMTQADAGLIRINRGERLRGGSAQQPIE